MSACLRFSDLNQTMFKSESARSGDHASAINAMDLKH